MARRRNPSTRNAVLASARPINLSNAKQAARQLANRPDWHEIAWSYFDTTPEVSQPVAYLGNQLAKIRLYPALANPMDPSAPLQPLTWETDAEDPDDLINCTEEQWVAAWSELNRLHSSTGGMAEIIRSANMNLEVVGEFYLVGLAKTDARIGVDGTVIPSRVEEWMVCSTEEIKKSAGGKISVIVDWATKPVDLTEKDFLVRIWVRHPRNKNVAYSPLQALLADCKALRSLTAQGIAEAQSRVPAGLLTIPNDLVFGDGTTAGNPDDGNDSELPPGTDSFMGQLASMLEETIDDPSAPGAFAPPVIRGPVDALKEIRLVSLARAEDHQIETKKAAHVTRIARGMNLPMEKALGHQECVDDTTEILTGNGWKSCDDLCVGDEVLTLNHESGLSEWQPVDRVSIYPAKSQPMVLLTGQSHSSLSTPNHRWPVISQRGFRRWRESSALNTNCRIIPGAPNADLPTNAKWADEFVELVAWWWTEGSDIRNGGGRIHQSELANPQHVASIRRALTSLVGPPSESLHRASRASGRAVCLFDGCEWPIHAQNLCDAHRYQQRTGVPLRSVRRSAPNPGIFDDRHAAWREYSRDGKVVFALSKVLTDQIREVAPNKYVEPWFLRSLTIGQLELFITRSVDGDGCRHNTGFQLHQVDPLRTERFEMACLMAGWAVTERVTVSTGGFKDSIRHQVLARTPRTHRIGYGVKVETVQYDGRVWCPTVANGTWMARRAGSVYFTGNTTFANGRQIDLDEYEDYHAPRATMLTDAFTHGFYRAQCAANPVLTDLAPLLVLAADPSALFGQPDPVANAEMAHKLLLISNSKTRELLGFTEDDAPAPDEIFERIALARGYVSTDMTSPMLQKLAGEAGITIPLVPVGPANRPNSNLAASGAITATSRVQSRIGSQLSALDRDLMTRLLIASSAAMTRALDRAGAKLSNHATKQEKLVVARVPKYQIAATLGTDRVQAITAASGNPLEGAWTDLEADYMRWGATAQSAALEAIHKSVVNLSTTDRLTIAARLAETLNESWAWTEAALNKLAGQRLFDPDPKHLQGEIDPNLKVPPGLIRESMARAGGLTAIRSGDDGTWVPLTADGNPVGGIATGTLITGVLKDAGGLIEAYIWDYGPGYRARPFEPHQELDGQTFASYDSEVLANNSNWPPFTSYEPGDHEMCQCSAIPTWTFTNEEP